MEVFDVVVELLDMGLQSLASLLQDLVQILARACLCACILRAPFSFV